MAPDFTPKEMMAIVFARDIQDGDRVCSGAHTEISFAAVMLAQKTHAPNMRLQLGGTCFLCNVVDMEIDELPVTSVDYRILQWAESAAHDHPETFLFYGPPGGRNYYADDSPYRNTSKYWFADKFFAGGIQADKFGNVNLIGLGSRDKLTLRGPGTVGINDTVVTVREPYVFVTHHDTRRLVEQVDFVSMPGRRTCKELNFLGGGAKWIVTPKAIFDFDPETDLARLAATFPGVTEEEVTKTTGFGFKRSPHFKPVPPPTREELEVLRNEVDRKGVLRRPD